jgi:catechol 2,3-dioxygenase-like lactoylglutathione lyase family enzyme
MDAAIVNHVGMCVHDLARSQRFYVEVLGFQVDRELRPPDGATGALLSIDPPVNLTALYLSRGSFVLELLHFDRPGNPPAPRRPFNEPGLTHISLSVEDMDATVALVPERGGEVVTNVMGAVMVRDPDGQVIELLPMAYRRALG